MFANLTFLELLGSRIKYESLIAMGKKRCKLSKTEYADKTCKGGEKYVCKKCARVAKNVKRLCSAKEIKRQHD